MNLAKRLFFISSILFFPIIAHAETGVVRNINCGSHSFGLDVPPLIRVYINAGTRFESGSCQDVKEGDKVEVEMQSTGPGTAIATRVKVVGRQGETVQQLASNELDAKLNQNFILGVSQTANVKDGDKTVLKIRSTEFVNTLCKEGYNCGDVGEVGMRMKVSSGGKEEDVLLTSQNGRKPVTPVKAEVSGYTIQLIECGEDVVSLVVRKS